MSKNLDRRHFITHSTLASTAASWTWSTASTHASQSPTNKVVLGIMGLNRGSALAKIFSQLAGVEVKYVCDVDSTRADNCAEQLQQLIGKRPASITDFRHILDDQTVDALVCAAPNHWHGPATILACAAGKHVYVEKPCCHNPREGELMVKASRKFRRAVQVGSQRRSGTGTIEAIQKLHAGMIGRVYLVRTWYHAGRLGIGQGKPTKIPTHLNYDLWQGPAPRRPYLDNIIHYNWHWRWHWGNGELGNNGIHTIDLARWGLNVDYPIRVTSSGGRYHYIDDDQETPDTQTVCFEFEGGRQITWEGLSCNRHGSGFATFYGDQGTLELRSNGDHQVFDLQEQLVHESSGHSMGQREHMLNFVNTIRNDQPLTLNADIVEAHKSTLLCHLGNIAHRTGKTLNCDPHDGHLRGDPSAMALWARDYDPAWKPNLS